MSHVTHKTFYFLPITTRKLGLHFLRVLSSLVDRYHFKESLYCDVGPTGSFRSSSGGATHDDSGTTSTVGRPELSFGTFFIHAFSATRLIFLQVCPRFKNLIESSSTIQYKIELMANGLVPCADSKVSSAVALKMLQEQQSRWRRCAWMGMKEINLVGGCRTYDLRRGIWLYGRDASGDQNLSDHTNSITCYRLGNAWDKDDKAEGWESWSNWCLEDLNLAIKDFAIDPDIDMLALVAHSPPGCVILYF